MDGSLENLVQQLFRELRDHAAQMEKIMYGRLQMLESRMEQLVCQCERQKLQKRGDTHKVRPVFEQVSFTHAVQEEPTIDCLSKEQSAPMMLNSDLMLNHNGSPALVNLTQSGPSESPVPPKVELIVPTELQTHNEGHHDVVTPAKISSEKHSKRKYESALGIGIGRRSEVRKSSIGSRGSAEAHESEEAEVPRSCLRRMVIHPQFDHCCVFVVIINSALVGLTIDHEAGSDSQPLKGIYKAIEYLCTAFFSVELFLRCAVHRWSLFKRPGRSWAIFDVVLVAISWLDIALEVIITDAESMPGPGASVGKMLKMMRMARIMRILRMVRFLTKIRIMAKMIAGSMVSLFWLLILLLAVMYIFAIVLTQGATMWLKPGGNESPPTQDDDYTPAKDYFGGVVKTTYTLFASITGGLSWIEAANVSQALGPIYFCVFLFFIFFSIFSVMNIVTGVFVDGAIQQANKDRSMKEQKLAEARAEIAEDLQDFLSSINTGCSGSLGREDLVAALADVKMQRSLEAMDIDVHDADDLWLFLDSGEDGLVDIQAFVQGMMRIKGPAKSIDTHILLVKVNKLLDGFDELKEKVSSIHLALLGNGRQSYTTSAKTPSARQRSRYHGASMHAGSLKENLCALRKGSLKTAPAENLW